MYIKRKIQFENYRDSQCSILKVLVMKSSRAVHERLQRSEN